MSGSGPPKPLKKYQDQQCFQHRGPKVPKLHQKVEILLNLAYFTEIQENSPKLAEFPISCDFDRILHSRRESTPPEGVYSLRFSNIWADLPSTVARPVCFFCIFLKFREIPDFCGKYEIPGNFVVFSVFCDFCGFHVNRASESVIFLRNY